MRYLYGRFNLIKLSPKDCDCLVGRLEGFRSCFKLRSQLGVCVFQLGNLKGLVRLDLLKKSYIGVSLSKQGNHVRSPLIKRVYFNV